MNLATLLVLLPLAAASRIPVNEDGNNWAVLVAGSSGWYNYRHQSDICHAYQIMKESGIPDERIIVMMYDDIADSSSNPHPGQLFNHPDMTTDVYAGVPKDYTGSDVTPEIFLAVLQGNKEAVNGRGSGKVVESGPNDRIFINLDDHGAVGLFAFPYSELMADEFADAVTAMHTANKYKEMTIYIEACESGSMFEDLYPAELKAYGLSASSPSESSWAIYCSTLDTCLGDEFSVNWMEDTDNGDINTETLNTQFVNTEKLTLGSQVMQWGDTSIDSQVLATFFGPTSSTPKKSTPKSVERSAIATQDVPLVLLENKLKSSNSDVEKNNLIKEIAELKERRQFVKSTMEKIAHTVTAEENMAKDVLVKSRSKVTNWNCYNPVVHAFSKNCFNLGQSTYALTTVHTLLNLCETGHSSESIISGIKSVCKFPTVFNAI